jgi:predicted negative regulator of RcsB-dependent stress response
VLRALDEGIERLGPLVALELPAIEIELAEGRWERALARVDRLAAQSPRQERWQTRRGDILLAAGRPAEARRAYLEARASIRSLKAHHRRSGLVLELRARVDRALERTSTSKPPEADD